MKLKLETKLNAIISYQTLEELTMLLEESEESYKKIWGFSIEESYRRNNLKLQRLYSK